MQEGNSEKIYENFSAVKKKVCIAQLLGWQLGICEMHKLLWLNHVLPIHMQVRAICCFTDFRVLKTN
jgi:hypothetical protein